MGENDGPCLIRHLRYYALGTVISLCLATLIFVTGVDVEILRRDLLQGYGSIHIFNISIVTSYNASEYSWDINRGNRSRSLFNRPTYSSMPSDRSSGSRSNELSARQRLGKTTHTIKRSSSSTRGTDTNPSRDLSEYERMLKRHGMESTRLHHFKSPYIFDPVIYNDKQFNISKAPGKRKMKYVSTFNAPDWFIVGTLNSVNRDFKRCPYSECYFDGQGKYHNQADVLMFFPGIKEKPPRPVGQIWSFCSWESPVHINFPSRDTWKDVFNWTMTYRLDSDVMFPNNRLAWRDSDSLLSDAQYEQIARRKSKPVAWFVSNCHTQSKRESYVKEMQKYIDVDIYGACGPHRCSIPECSKKLNDTYKFYLSFENSICNEYLTEKFFRNIDERIQIVSVVRGGLAYENYFPPNTFINARKFSDAKALALFLKDLGNDIGRYSAMLKKKDRLKTLNYKHDWCEFCEKLHTGDFYQKVIPDIEQNFKIHGGCWSES